VSKSKALKRYNHRVIILSLIYAVILIAAVYGFKHHLLSGPIAYVAAILPALPIIAILGAIGRYLTEETDEYLRVMMVRQALIATAFSLSIATAWGFLENFDLVPHVYAYYAVILWFAGLGVGACINKLQAAGGEA
jgi:xanthosine utilization system XapX-like protein